MAHEGFEPLNPSPSGDKSMSRRTLFPGPWTLLAFAVILILIAYQVFQWAQERVLEVNNPDAQPRAVTPRGDLASDEKSTIEIYEQNRSAVVHITSLAAKRDRFSLDIMKIPAGMGSGFIWEDSGYIVTNFHVIQGAAAAEVTLAGEKSGYNAQLVGAYPEMDLAVLKINTSGKKLRALPIGTSSELKVGQKVFAIGNPFGLDQSLTTGIISALDRNMAGDSGVELKNLIQTDAAINPGNSGGPLLDSAGRLIGVNTAILSPSGVSNGIGFAIPVDEVNRIVPQLIRNGKVTRPVMGITLASDQTAKDNGIEGLLITAVSPKGPAAKAGIVGLRSSPGGRATVGDVLKECEGTSLKRVRDLHDILAKKTPGETIQIKVERDGEIREIKVILVEPEFFQPDLQPKGN